MKDKIINVTSSSMPPLEEYMQEISTIWQNKWLTNAGLKHQELEKNLKEYLNVNGLTLYSNGHLALEAALSVLNLSGEVITTPYTFASTTQAIVRAGLTPVFCDINENDFTIDVDKIEALITEKTSAILPVHVYGNICDYNSIEKIAKKYNLKVIYDAAHAFGVTSSKVNVARLGDISMYSFHATKVFHTIEGGGLTFSDTTMEKELVAWRQFGMYGKEDAESIGANAKLTEFQAAMGLCNLRHLDEEMNKRKKVHDRYVERLEKIKGLKVFKPQKEFDHNYAYFPIIIDPCNFGEDRNQLAERLAKYNVFTRKYFYPLTSSFSVYQGMFPIQPTPIAQKIANQVLALPIYADLTQVDVDNICDLILEVS